MNSRSRIAALIAAAALVLAGCASPAADVPQNVVTGVTITGAGVTGTGGNKELTVTIGTDVDLGVTVTKSGSPSVAETWSSAGAAVEVGATTGLVKGVTADATGILVTVKVGGKTDTILVKVVAPTPGLNLEFDQTKLEFQKLTATTFIDTLKGAQAPTVVKSASGVITLTNYDGTFKQTTTGDSLQGSSFLLYNTALTGNFEVKAAVKITATGGAAGSDKYLAGLGMFTTDANGAVTLASQAAIMGKRTKPDFRSLWSKANTVGGLIGAGNPNVTANITTSDYHILTVKRLGTSVYFEENGYSATVTINTVASNDGVTNANGEIWSTLSGSVKVGLVAAGVTTEVEGFVINELNTDGSFKTELYKAGALPTVAIPVDSVAVTAPAAAIDMASPTLQLTTTLTPATATTGTAITYSVKDANDTNVTVSTAGLVTASGAGDGAATVVATSANGKTAEYAITLTDSTQVVTGVTIPATLSLPIGQSQSLTTTILPGSVSNKTVTWTTSNSAVITVNATTGALSVTSGASVGATAVIKATSAANTSIVSNDCTVTVAAAVPIVYSFPDGNWFNGNASATTFLASGVAPTITAPATSATTNFNVLGAGGASPVAGTLNTVDSLTYKSASAGKIRLRYSPTVGNAVNFNGSSLSANATMLPAIGGSVGTEGSLYSYIAVPLSGVSTTNVKVDLDLRVATSTSGSVNTKAALVGSDFNLLATTTVDTTTASGSSATVYTLTWTGSKANLSSLLVIFGREGATGGGLDVRSITVTPQ